MNNTDIQIAMTLTAFMFHMPLFQSDVQLSLPCSQLLSQYYEQLKECYLKILIFIGQRLHVF